jgi:hypothetical protein
MALVVPRLKVKATVKSPGAFPLLLNPAIARRVRVITLPEICPLCHKPLKTHEFCDSCGIGIGENHIETKTFYAGGNHVCRWCKNHGYTQRAKDIPVEVREG